MIFYGYTFYFSLFKLLLDGNITILVISVVNVKDHVALSEHLESILHKWFKVLGSCLTSLF